jgi:hypothetical protein
MKKDRLPTVMESRGLFPNDPDPPKWETVRVLKRGPEYTTVLVVRTESDPEPKRWHLLTDRVPEFWIVGFEGGIRYTPMELDWLQGFRDLPSATIC